MGPGGRKPEFCLMCLWKCVWDQDVQEPDHPTIGSEKPVKTFKKGTAFVLEELTAATLYKTKHYSRHS